MIIIFIREIFSFVIYFGIFEFFCNVMIFEGDGVGYIGFLGLLFVGGLSGILFWFFIYLIDVVKLRF